MSTGPYDPNIQYGAAPASPTGPSTPMGTPAGAPPAYGMGGQYPAPGQAPSTPPSTKRKGIIALIAGLAVLSLLITGGILAAYKDSGDSSDSAAGGSSASAGADSSGGKLGDKASKAAVGDCIDSLTDPSATIVSCDNASAKFKVVATSTTKESCVTTPGGDYFNAATCYNDLSAGIPVEESVNDAKAGDCVTADESDPSHPAVRKADCSTSGALRVEGSLPGVSNVPVIAIPTIDVSNPGPAPTLEETRTQYIIDQCVASGATNTNTVYSWNLGGTSFTSVQTDNPTSYDAVLCLSDQGSQGS